MTRQVIGMLCLGIVVFILLVGMAVATFDAVLHKDRASMTTVIALAVLTAGAWWGLSG